MSKAHNRATKRRSCAERIRAASKLRARDVPKGETRDQYTDRLLESAVAALAVAQAKVDALTTALRVSRGRSW